MVVIKSKCICNGKKVLPRYCSISNKLSGSYKCFICNGGYIPNTRRDEVLYFGLSYENII